MGRREKELNETLKRLVDDKDLTDKAFGNIMLMDIAKSLAVLADKAEEKKDDHFPY